MNERVIRIEHIDRIRKAYIFWKDNIVAEIYHEYSSLSGEFDWVIRPIWSTWEKCEKQGWLGGIAGIDDTLRKEEYIRRYNPYFVTQRTLSSKRPDLPELLEAIDLTYNDLFEVMCRTHAVCGNDSLYVSRTPDKTVDVRQRIVPYDMPDFNTDDYGWLDRGYYTYEEDDWKKYYKDSLSIQENLDKYLQTKSKK